MTRITSALLLQQDDVCSAAVLEILRDRPAFQSLATREGEDIIRRDQEDEEKLAVGIEIAKAKGILSGNPDVSAVTRIDVAGKSAQDVTEEILRRLPGKEGNVIVIQGLSGTGKGTTVGKLQKQLPRCVSWSNGNVFRSYTHLCLAALHHAGGPLPSEKLTPELIQSVEKQVTFGKIGAGVEFDIVLNGSTRVADVQNTLLKTPEISAAVPTVAQQTQGEVIRFGSAAVRKLSEAGHNVILEGRAQTLNYISTPLRFELVIGNTTLLGERRAAQRVMAKALAMIKEGGEKISDEEAQAAVLKAVEEM